MATETTFVPAVTTAFVNGSSAAVSLNLKVDQVNAHLGMLASQMTNISTGLSEVNARLTELVDLLSQLVTAGTSAQAPVVMVDIGSQQIQTMEVD